MFTKSKKTRPSLLLIPLVLMSCKPRIDRSELREGLDFLNAESPDPKFVTNLTKMQPALGSAIVSFADPLKRLVYVGYAGGRIGVWDVNKNALVTSWKIEGAGDVTALAVGGQFEKRLIAVGDREGKMFFGSYNVNEPKAQFSPSKEGMKGQVTGVGVAAFGDLVVAAASSGEVRIWVLSSSFNPSGPVFSREGLPDRVRTDGDSQKGQNSQVDRRSKLAINDLVLLEDNSFVISRDADVELWNPVSMIPTSLPGSEAVINGKKITRITSLGAIGARSPNCAAGQAVIAAGEDTGRVIFFNVQLVNGRWLPSEEDIKLAEAVAKFKSKNSSGSAVGVSSSNGGTGTIDANRMRPKVINCNEADKQVSAAAYQTIKSFNSDNQGTIPWSIDPAKTQGIKGHTQSITDVTFSRDARKLVTASSDGTIGIWEVGSKKMLRKLRIPSSSISTTAFSDMESRVFFTETGGGKLLSWNQAAMDTIYRIDPKPGTAAAFSPDGMNFAFATNDNTLRIAKTYSAAGWLGKPDILSEQKVANTITTIAFVPEPLAKASDVAIVTAQCDGVVTAWRYDEKGLRIKGSFDILSVEAQLGGAIDLSSSFVNSCAAFDPAARIVIGTSSDNSGGKLVVSYPTTGNTGIVVWNLDSLVPLGAYPYPPDESFMKTELRPSSLLVKGRTDVMELRSMDEIILDDRSKSADILEQYPLQFNRKTRAAIFRLSQLDASNIRGSIVGEIGNASAVAVAPSSDLVAYGGRNRLLNVTRLTDRSQSFSVPQNYQDAGASVPGLAHDLSLSKDGIAVMAAENGVFLIWASEIYFHTVL